MSSYLTFRKGGINLCSFSRSTAMYQAFPSASYDKWTKVTPDTLRAGIQKLQADRKEYEKQIDIYNEMLKQKLSYEERFSTINTIKEFEEEITDVEFTICKIYMLIDIAEEKTDGKDYPMEWSVD